MGAVYLAEDLNLAGRPVAIKENLNNHEEAQRQFRREAVLLAHLRHPHLPQVLDYFIEPGGHQYLVMEYVPGENLQEVIRSKGPLPVQEAVACVDQIMQAVAYMHGQRNPENGHRRPIIHRDIKPANIKRTPEGRYLLVDFGIAKQNSLTVQVTAVSARALTPGYAPIEQYGAGTDERSDIYALGATLYALLTGKTPPSSIDLAAGAPLPPLRSHNSKISADLARAVERAMKLNAGERFANIDEMYAAITGRAIPTTPITTGSLPWRTYAPPLAHDLGHRGYGGACGALDLAAPGEF
jgi:serine/threonine-protein kinase